MSKKVHLTLAVGDYESIRALKEGTVKADGIELTVITDMTSSIRHWRMLRNREFDCAELSMSNYLMAKYTDLPFVAIPVFLHRRFRHGFVFVNTSKGITKPTDLIGRKVGLRNFQATANLWIRGILEHEYDVPHRSLNWLKQDDEEVDWTPPADLKIARIPAGKSIDQMLVDGEIDALIHPELIQPILDKDSRVTRLFPNYRDLEMDYFKRTGIFPIMHTTAIKQEVVDKYPWVPLNLYQALEASKQSRLQTHGKSAHRAARLVSLVLGRTGRTAWARSLDLRSRRCQSQSARNADAVFPGTGFNRPQVGIRRTVYQHRGSFLAI